MCRLRYVLIAVVCVGMSFGTVLAQDDALEGGTLSGLITDLTPDQNPIEGVEVKIVAQDSGKEWTTKTNADGEYEQALLPVGRYLISISKDGYDERTGKPVNIVDSGDHFISLKMSKKGNIKPPFGLQPTRMNTVMKRRIESLRQLLSENIGERYDLDAVAINTLRLSIPESVETALEQDSRNILVFGKASEGSNIALIKMLLSHPVCKTVFTRHLSEAQLQDYLEFTEAREIRDRHAVVHWITATLDKELSLRADQREEVVQSFLDTAENELFPSAMNALPLRPQQAAQLAHYRLKVSLDGVLSEAQSKVWEGLVSTKPREKNIVILDLPKVDIKKAVADEQGKEKEGADVNKKRPFIRKVAPKFVNIEKEINIVINEVDVREMQPWNEVNPAASEEQIKQRAESKLMAHTELLGPLDERATRRLALAAKGVAQQYFEAQDETLEAKYRAAEAELMRRVEAGEISREQAAARLKIMRRDLAHEADTNAKGKDSDSDITHHPLYQRAIKDVLSEEAFTQYSEHQAERAALHQQALRDIVVACVDMQLLLDDMQREQLERAASQLVPGRLKARNALTLMFFQLFPQTVDFEVLTPWQQGEFERVFGPMMWRR